MKRGGEPWDSLLLTIHGTGSLASGPAQVACSVDSLARRKLCPDTGDHRSKEENGTYEEAEEDWGGLIAVRLLGLWAVG